MLKTGIFLSLFLLASGANSTEYSETNVKAFCGQKWGAQYDMVQYCMKKQRKGYIEYSRFKNFLSDLNNLGAAFTHCEQKWDGQWDMVNYCAGKQVTAAKNLADIKKALPATVSAEISTHCESKWQPQIDMQEYCVKKQARAWIAINQ